MKASSSLNGKYGIKRIIVLISHGIDSRRNVLPEETKQNITVPGLLYLFLTTYSLRFCQLRFIVSCVLPPSTVPKRKGGFSSSGWTSCKYGRFNSLQSPLDYSSLHNKMAMKNEAPLPYIATVTRKLPSQFFPWHWVGFYRPYGISCS